MAENDDSRIQRQSSRKSRSPTTSAVPQAKESQSSSNSPSNQGISSGNPSRGRQLWNLAVESVLEHERTTLTPTGTSAASSTSGNEPIGWYNLTKR